MSRNALNTNLLPKYNCSNCKYFISENKEIFESKFYHKRFNLGNKEQIIEYLIEPYLKSVS